MAYSTLAGSFWDITLEYRVVEKWGRMFFNLVDGGEYTSASGQRFGIQWRQDGQGFNINILDTGGTLTLTGEVGDKTGSGTITESPPPVDSPAVYKFVMTLAD